MKYEMALQFLFFSYFHVDLRDIEQINNKDILLEVAINRAYIDATQQGAYDALFQREEKAVKKISEKARCESGKELKTRLKELSGIDNSQEYDSWHENICDQIVMNYATLLKEYCAEEKFSYGNAQKWVNMTIKYLYIMCGVFDENTVFWQEIGKDIMAVAPFHHAPVDRNIIRAAWEANVKLPLKPDKLCKSGERGKYDDQKVKAWSSWKKDDYKEFYKSLRINVLNSAKGYPLDWENEKWLEFAKNKK